MKIITFIDLENFKHSLWKMNSKREPIYDNLHKISEKIVNKLDWKKYNPRHIRTYVYTGEYTENLMPKIKFLKTKLSREWQQEKLENCLQIALKRRKSQQNLFDYLHKCSFFEIKTTPIKFDLYKKKPFFQKGVDVLIATDILSHAYQDNFDVAVLCSGDLDLIESIKLVKRLGKKLIIVSHRSGDDSGISKKLIKESDYFLNISDFSEDELNKISEVIKDKKIPDCSHVA